MEYVMVRGAQIPKIGLGTFSLVGDTGRSLIASALERGYRHIDTAQSYGNEAEVGAAISASSVPRQDIFLTTKIAPERFRQNDLQRSVDESIRRLGTTPDLLLLHWPNPAIPLRETLAALDKVKRQGLTRHIGVSNFTTALIEAAVTLCDEPLLVNQVEYHPFLAQRIMLRALRQDDMALVAYSPLAQGNVSSDPTLQEIAARLKRTPGQVALRWLIQQDGVAAIPRSANVGHLEANLAVFDFVLDDDDMARIAALARPDGRLVDPAGMAPEWDA